MPTRNTPKPEAKEAPAESAKPAERQNRKMGVTTKVGNVTRDPELASGASGMFYCRFGLAVDTPKTAGDWQGEKITTFYDVVCFGDLAENVAQSVARGTRVIVTGSGELEHWTDSEGKPRTTKKIAANACGPDLRWAVADVTRVSGHNGPLDGSSDQLDEEPF